MHGWLRTVSVRPSDHVNLPRFAEHDPMETFKRLDDIALPDVRNTLWVATNLETGEQRKMALSDIYESVALIDLHESVPDDVRSQFNVAKNLAVYTWYCYPFHQISELKAFSTLEMALRMKFGENGQRLGFKRLLRKAVASGLIKDIGFSHIADNVENPESTVYTERLPDQMPDLRNNLAHGSCTLHPYSEINLQICADFINQLFHT